MAVTALKDWPPLADVNAEPGGSITSITAGAGITLAPNPITTTGTVALTTPAVAQNGTTPLTADWNAGNFKIVSQNSMPVFNVAAYGALNTGAGDQTAAIQAAINAAAAAGQGIVQFEAGTYRHTGTLTVTNSRIMFRGAGQYTTSLFFARAIGDAVQFTGPISGNGWQDMGVVCFDDTNMDGFGVNARVSGKGIKLTSVGNFFMTNASVIGGWDGLYMDACNSGFIQNVQITSSLFPNQSNNGVSLVNNSIANIFMDVIVNATNIGFLVDGQIDTADFYRCGAQKNANADTKYGFNIKTTAGPNDPQWVRFFDCSSETSDINGICWYIQKGHGIELYGCQTSWGLNAIQMSAVAPGDIHDVSIFGGLYMLAGQDGIVNGTNSATDVVIDGATISNNGWSVPNSFDGIILADGSKNWRISNCRIGHSMFGATPPPPTGGVLSQRYGINCAGAAGSTNVKIHGNDLTGNISGAITLSAFLPASTTVFNNEGTDSNLVGLLGIGTLTPTRQIDVTGTTRWRGIAPPAVSEVDSGTIYYDSASDRLKVSLNGGAYVDLVGSAGLTGTGAATKVGYWTNATNLDSLANIYVDAVNHRLGIKQAAPAYELDIAGELNFAGAAIIRVNGSTVIRSDSINGLAMLGPSIPAAPGVETTAMGHGALGATTQAGNTAVGSRALDGTTTGTDNTSIGRDAGRTNTVGTNNTLVGYTADVSVNNLNRATAIGYAAVVADSDAMVLGDGNCKVGLRTSTPKAALDVNGAVCTRHLDIVLGGGANEDIALTQSSWIRVTGPGAGFTLGGFTNGVDGRILRVLNTTAQAMTIKNLSGGSAANNQILTLTGGDVVLPARTSSATFVYEDSQNKWILTATS